MIVGDPDVEVIGVVPVHVCDTDSIPNPVVNMIMKCNVCGKMKINRGLHYAYDCVWPAGWYFLTKAEYRKIRRNQRRRARKEAKKS